MFFTDRTPRVFHVLHLVQYTMTWISSALRISHFEDSAGKDHISTRITSPSSYWDPAYEGLISRISPYSQPPNGDEVHSPTLPTYSWHQNDLCWEEDV